MRVIFLSLKLWAHESSGSGFPRGDTFPRQRRENKNPTKTKALASICSCRVSVGVSHQSQKGVSTLSETTEFGHHER